MAGLADEARRQASEAFETPPPEHGPSAIAGHQEEGQRMTPPENHAYAVQASADRYVAGLRDLAGRTSGMPELAAAMARMIRAQFPGADGRAVIAAAQAAIGACEMVEQDGGNLNATGVINLIALAGRELGKEPGDG